MENRDSWDSDEIKVPDSVLFLMALKVKDRFNSTSYKMPEFFPQFHGSTADLSDEVCANVSAGGA